MCVDAFLRCLCVSPLFGGAVSVLDRAILCCDNTPLRPCGPNITSLNSLCASTDWVCGNVGIASERCPALSVRALPLLLLPFARLALSFASARLALSFTGLPVYPARY